MNNKVKQIFQLFISNFYISSFTFGGGYVIVPLMKKKFVDELKWIDEKEMLDMIAIAQSAPGPIAVNTSILVGYRTCGFIGFIFAALGTVLPPLITLSVFSLFYDSIKSLHAAEGLLNGLQAGAAAVVADAVYSLCTSILKEKKRAFSAIIMILSFTASFVFKVNIMLILAVCMLAGIVYALIMSKNRKEPGQI